MLIAKHLI